MNIDWDAVHARVKKGAISDVADEMEHRMRRAMMENMEADTPDHEAAAMINTELEHPWYFVKDVANELIRRKQG